MAGPTRRTALRTGALAGVLLAAASGARADELAASNLLIRGSRLLVTPAEQTTACIPVLIGLLLIGSSLPGSMTGDFLARPSSARQGAAATSSEFNMGLGNPPRNAW